MDPVEQAPLLPSRAVPRPQANQQVVGLESPNRILKRREGSRRRARPLAFRPLALLTPSGGLFAASAERPPHWAPRRAARPGLRAPLLDWGSRPLSQEPELLCATAARP
jgi:hypothetical protein